MEDKEQVVEQSKSKKRGGALRALKTGSRRLTLGLGSSALVLLLTTAIAIMSLVSLAWLAENRNLEAGSQAMDMNDKLFELSIPGTIAGNVTTKNPKVADPDWTATGSTGGIIKTETLDAWLGTNYDTSESAVTTNTSQGVVSLLNIRLDEKGEKHFMPNAIGYLEFYIQPEADGLLFFSTAQLLPMFKGSPSDATKNNVMNLLNSHIVFFNLPTSLSLEDADTTLSADAFKTAQKQRLDAQRATHVYGNLIHSGDLFQIVTGENGTGTFLAGETYRVVIGFEWLVTYSRVETLYSGQTLPSDLLYFPGATPSPLTNNDKRDGYNNADQLIADNVRYVAVQAAVNVTQTPPQSPPARQVIATLVE